MCSIIIHKEKTLWTKYILQLNTGRVNIFHLKNVLSFKLVSKMDEHPTGSPES